jgi:hypothetical protein
MPCSLLAQIALRVCDLAIRERDLAALLNSQVRISSLKFSLKEYP